MRACNVKMNAMRENRFHDAVQKNSKKFSKQALDERHAIQVTTHLHSMQNG